MNMMQQGKQRNTIIHKNTRERGPTLTLFTYTLNYRGLFPDQIKDSESSLHFLHRRKNISHPYTQWTYRKVRQYLIHALLAVP